MGIIECMLSSFRSLFHNKLRSLLTMLGIIIGVTSVILLTSIGEGVKNKVSSQVEELGANLLYVFPGKVETKPSTNGKSQLGVKNGMLGSAKSPFVYEDVLALKNKENIAAVTGVYNSVDKLDILNLLVSTTGVDEDFIQTNKLELEQGRFISKEDRERKAPVAVIGDQVNKEIFNGENSIGKTFTLNSKEYEVIGILKYKKPENMGPGSEDINVKIYLTITELLSRAKEKNISRILVKATTSQAVDPAEEIIRTELDRNHPSDAYSIIKQQDMVNTVADILNMLNAALGGIAGISLVVGGIGIMNIMLVSVVERTREIGVRKAIGARRRDILAQFLIEAVTLSIVGALIGLAAGIWGSKLIPRLAPMVPTAVSVPAAIISILFAFLIGVFFGVFPAAKAARLDPIEALRNE